MAVEKSQSLSSGRVSKAMSMRESFRKDFTIFPKLEIVFLCFTSIPVILAKLLQPLFFRVHIFDTGIYGNLLWNLAHGRGYYSSVLERNHLGEHFSPIMALLVPFCYLLHPVYVLMAAQGICIAATMVLLLAIMHDVLKELGEFPRRVLAVGT